MCTSHVEKKKEAFFSYLSIDEKEFKAETLNAQAQKWTRMSGVCWRLPVPSAINKKTSVTSPTPPPHPHPDSWCSVSVAAGCEIRHLHTHTPPHPESAGSRRLLRVLRRQAQLLAFQHWGETERFINSGFSRTLQWETLSPSEINLHFKELLSSKQGDLCGRVVRFTPQEERVD